MSLEDAPIAELSVFIVTPSSIISGRAADISDINGISCRKRKRHSKSRSGCIPCKKRRVKVSAHVISVVYTMPTDSFVSSAVMHTRFVKIAYGEKSSAVS